MGKIRLAGDHVESLMTLEGKKGHSGPHDIRERFLLLVQISILGRN